MSQLNLKNVLYFFHTHYKSMSIYLCVFLCILLTTKKLANIHFYDMKMNIVEGKLKQKQMESFFHLFELWVVYIKLFSFMIAS